MGYIFSIIPFVSCTLEHLKASDDRLLSWEDLCICPTSVGGAQDTTLAVWSLAIIKIILSFT